ncbi:MAG: GIY-YIG nuclease family protein [Chloroflexota bacterium]
MHFVYILESLRNGKHYTGRTSKSVEARLREHNGGANKWTRANRPFKLLHIEEFDTLAEAATREKFLKSGAGRKIRDQLVDD